MEKKLPENLLEGKSGKNAGDFSHYAKIEDVFADGWLKVKDNLYDIKLIDANTTPVKKHCKSEDDGRRILSDTKAK